MKKLGAFIITFNRSAILKATIETILAQSRPPEYILVVDNGSSVETARVVEQFRSPSIAYLDMVSNGGPAGAAASGLAKLIELDYEWLYWVDDDDPPRTPDTLERLLFLATEHNLTTIGGVGAVGARFDWAKGEIIRLPDQSLQGSISVDIISGSSQFILNQKAVTDIGLPDRQLFFGFEEPEYCLRMRRKGWQLFVDGDLMYQYRTLAGRLNLQYRRNLRLQYDKNTFWRQYYSTRNYIYAMQNTFERPDLARREALRALGRVCFSWTQGIKYGAAFSYLQLRGIVDGYYRCMGRTVLPQPKQ